MTPERLWKAYEILDQSKVKRTSPGKLFTNIISILRFELGEADILEPFPETVDSKFEKWISRRSPQAELSQKSKKSGLE